MIWHNTFGHSYPLRVSNCGNEFLLFKEKWRYECVWTVLGLIYQFIYLSGEHTVMYRCEDSSCSLTSIVVLSRTEDSSWDDIKMLEDVLRGACVETGDFEPSKREGG